MSHASIEIRSATAEELPQAVGTIVAAFVADPPARFAWPSARDYLQTMPVATRAFAGSCVDHGTAYVTADFRGAALWLPPGAQADNAALDKVFRDSVQREHLDDLLATFERMEMSHPREAHWYLPQIGVDPTAQGQGLGAQLMRHALARCDEEQALAYLEASKPENIPFYQGHGFEVIGEIQVGKGPVITPMLRMPRHAVRDMRSSH
ncbi:GNAT family N-acetyltransferase [Ramlibacter pallidus]|uniref:GNAT family N-acetyltransferase n=1 Tax=Ramlibacter pallidus TaxID=2780087 RepID=A0ABR9S740_9BURK|nr:GNAT family N-acetyltransferase [Ramlibacter pallidus]MBE7368884.1 GNAT family N-acetyltransferase [Ramlibacter pallidus]